MWCVCEINGPFGVCLVWPFQIHVYDITIDSEQYLEIGTTVLHSLMTPGKGHTWLHLRSMHAYTTCLTPHSYDPTSILAPVS